MSKPALLIIDVQKGLDSPSLGERNNPGAESKIALFLEQWRAKEFPVVHVKHNSTEPNSPLRPGLPGNQIKPEAAPLTSEVLFEKTVNNAFIGTDLENYLRREGIEDLFIVGLTTDHCVSTTVRMAANLGFAVRLVSDATATFERTSHTGESISAEQVHQVSLASLNGEFCMVIACAELLEESDGAR